AEDHADSRELLREIVESFGATVVVAGDGEDALRKVARVRPGLVLCDLRMPLLDGFGFIDRLRRDPALSRTPVIAVTALGTETDVIRTWRARGSLVLDRSPHVGSKPLAGIRILVVDDNADCLGALRVLLQFNGADVQTVTSADEARAALAQSRPHVLISDLNMPGEDGFSL